MKKFNVFMDENSSKTSKAKVKKDKKPDDDPCWDGYRQYGMKDKDGKEVPNCVKESVEDEIIIDDDLEFYCIDLVSEATYRGKKVKLNKPMAGDVKKFKVYVKNAEGNVVKVNFGQKGMRIRKNNPKRRKAFRDRFNCDSPGPKWKARYWSCKNW